MEEKNTYTQDDWIAHSSYGIGQIKGIDTKNISGTDTRYYRVKTNDSTFWIPVEQMDSEVLRPLSTPEEIQQAIATLQKPAETMSSNYKMRQKRIKRAYIRNTPKALARLLRDLRAYWRSKGILNSTERNAYKTIKQRLIEEWVLVKNTKAEKVESRIERFLDPRIDNLPETSRI